MISFIGLYGGNDQSAIPQKLRDELDSCYVIPSSDPRWKWKNADLCVRQWFKDEGYKLSFNHIHIGEWDMLTLLNLKSMCPTYGQNSMTCKFDYKRAKALGWRWIKDDDDEWLLIKNHFQKFFGFDEFEDCNFGEMGGTFMCRDFLEKYAEIKPTELNNDEVRVGLYSKLWSIDLVDNGFKKIGDEYHTADTRLYDKFNKEYLLEGLKKNIKVLHPVREYIELSEIELK